MERVELPGDGRHRDLVEEEIDGEGVGTICSGIGDGLVRGKRRTKCRRCHHDMHRPRGARPDYKILRWLNSTGQPKAKSRTLDGSAQIDCKLWIVNSLQNSRLQPVGDGRSAGPEPTRFRLTYALPCRSWRACAAMADKYGPRIGVWPRWGWLTRSISARTIRSRCAERPFLGRRAMSKQQTFDLMGAESASERMQILLHFIEFWLGPRRPEYGESAEKLAALRLPMPLHVLYEFAGRWPRFYPLPNYEPWNHALAHLDHLRKLDDLQFARNGRLILSTRIRASGSAAR